MKLPQSAESNPAYMCFESARTMKSMQMNGAEFPGTGHVSTRFEYISNPRSCQATRTLALWVPLSFAHSSNETVDDKFRTLLK
jgi:hypothetical protein